MNAIRKKTITAVATLVISDVIFPSTFILAQEKVRNVERKQSQDGDAGVNPRAESDEGRGLISSKDFISRESMDKFIDSLGEVSRQTAINKQDASIGVKTVLDLRIPLIDKDCDITISHQMLKLAYAYYASFPNSDVELRRAAEQISRLSDKDLAAVTPQCKKNLRGFAFSILKVFLGSEWSPSDEEKVKEFLQEPKTQK